jgi:feruloyl esterase
MVRFERRRVVKRGLVALAATLPMLCAVHPAEARPASAKTGVHAARAQRCTALAGRTIAGAVIAKAALQPSAAAAGASCLVDAALHETLRFRVALPANWNGRLLYEGGGGWNGAISPQALAPAPERAGYAIVASDSGHQANGIDASWALGNPQAQMEFAFLSVHSVSEATKAIVRAFYGNAPHHSYFEGCSNGGREALVSASRFPGDFDGIIARSPANYWSGLFTSFLLHAQRQLSTPAAAIGPQQAQIVEQMALRQCDALDGLADGIIANPGACHVPLEEARCKPGSTAQCLSGEQVKTAETFYAGFTSADGKLTYPGWSPGGEGQGWPVWQGGAPGAPRPIGAQGLFGEGFYKYWVLADANADMMRVDPDQHRAALALADTLLTASPDLRTFFGLGNKLILWHGTADWAITYRASVRYYDEVSKAVGGDARRDQSMEFYLAPGVQHCGGGSGADAADLLTPLQRWVEAGKRPSDLVAQKKDQSGKVVLARPLCRYPAIPQYNGGDVNAASSFSCQKPKPAPA